jgi:hypothetical protein
MRTRALARSDGRIKVVSDRLNCSASACMVALSMPRASSNTHSGLPPKVDSAKTLSRRKA